MQTDPLPQASELEPVEVFPSAGDHAVRQYFESAASFWKDIYREDTLSARIYQERMQLAFAWIDSLALAPSSRILDVGCGAGLATVALAQRGFRVTALDLSPGMLEQTNALVQQHNVADRVDMQLASAAELPFADGSFTLVLALGLLPWLERAAETVVELSRVVAPGGYLLISADNHWRCDHLFDPAMTPVLRPVRQAVAKTLEFLGLRRTQNRIASNHRPSEVVNYTNRCGFGTTKRATLGFGPFSLLNCPVLNTRQSLRLHRFLQEKADGNRWPWTHCGRQYLQLSRRPDA